MAFLYRYSIRHPWKVVATAILITAGIAPGAALLKIRTDGHALVPPDAPEVVLDRKIRDEFGVEDPIVVLIRSNHEDGLFNTRTLTLVQELTDEFQQIDGIHPWNVISLAVERGDRVRPGTLIFRYFLEPIPKTRQELQRLRDDLRAIRLYNGILVSYDESATSILVGVPSDMDRTALYHTLQDIVAGHGKTPEEIHVIGAPVAEALLGTHILEDLGVPPALLGQRTTNAIAPSPWHLPRNLYDLRLLVGQRIGLVPVALFVMATVFLIAFRSLAAVALPLMEVGACLVFVFGLMGRLGVPVYLTIAVLPVMLTAIGVADEIHIFARYQELLRARPDDDHRDVLADTMHEMWVPVVKTSITTTVGFLSFALSPIRPVQAFGIFTAVGVLFCMLWSLTVIPALLAMLGPRSLAGRRRRSGTGPRGLAALFGRFGTIVQRLRYAVIVLTLLILAVAPYGLRRVVVQDSWVDGFAPRSEFYRATQWFNEQFLGMHTLLVCADAGQVPPLTGKLTRAGLDHRAVRIPADRVANPDDLVGDALYLRRPGYPGQPNARRGGRPIRYAWDTKVEGVTRVGDTLVLTTTRQDGSPRIALRLQPGEEATYELRPEWYMRPEVVRRIGELDAFIERHKAEAVGGVLGTADYIATTEYMIQGRKPGSRHVPDRRDRMEWVWGQYKRVRGEARWKQAVNADYTRALLSIYMKDANFVGTKRLMADIRRYEKEHLAAHDITLSFAGDVAVSQTLIRAIVTTQVRSLIVSLIGIFAVTALFGRSLSWGILCVLPCSLAVLINFAVMGLTGMPLGVATSMFSGMTLGIGVDYAIHLMERYRHSRERGLDLETALTDALRATGPAICIDALAVAVGFGVLLLSQVPANERLGGLVVLSIAGCCGATLLLLPALIRLFRLGSKIPIQPESELPS